MRGRKDIPDDDEPSMLSTRDTPWTLADLASLAVLVVLFAVVLYVAFTDGSRIIR